MGYSVRRAAHGGDRRHGRSLAETLTFGKGIDEPYDEAVGPRDMTRRNRGQEWEPTEWEQLESRRNRDAVLDAVTDAFKTPELDQASIDYLNQLDKDFKAGPYWKGDK